MKEGKRREERRKEAKGELEKLSDGSILNIYLHAGKMTRGRKYFPRSVTIREKRCHLHP